MMQIFDRLLYAFQVVLGTRPSRDENLDRVCARCLSREDRTYYYLFLEPGPCARCTRELTVGEAIAVEPGRVPRAHL